MYQLVEENAAEGKCTTLNNGTMNTNEEYINEESAATQCNRILAHLKKGLLITSLEALQLFGCMRLASRISDLRKRGENIVVERVKTNSGKYVAQYKMAV